MTAFPIPLEALDADIAILGKKGRGKTNAAKTIAEKLLDQGKRILVLDPVSAWYGLRTLADGKTKGYPVAVFGGPHGDMPINDRIGRELGKVLAAEPLPAIIDMGGMRKAEQHRLVGDLLEELFLRNRDPLWLFLEEAHHWAPQKPMDGDSNKTLGEVIRIATQARARGIRLISLTQRPARLHKDVLTQLSVLVALGVTSPQDRDAVKDWVEGNADRDLAKEVYGSLASLKRGEAWVWAPDLDILRRVQFPLTRTLDTSATPQHGEKRVSPKALADVDLGPVRTALASADAEARANDPATLRKRITELERQLASKTVLPDEKALERARQDGWHEGHGVGSNRGALDGQAAMGARMRTYFERIGDMLGKGGIIAGEAITEIGRVQPIEAPARPAPSRSRETPGKASVLQKPPSRAKQIPEKRRSIAGSEGDNTISRPQQRILDAVAWWAALGDPAPTRVKVAFVSGYKPNTGTFNTYLSALNTAGLIEYPAQGRVKLSADGEAAAEHLGASPTVEELHDRVRQILSGPQIAMLDVLLDNHPAGLSRDELARATNYQPNTGTFNTYVSSLSSLEIAEYPQRGTVKAADWLFP